MDRDADAAADAGSEAGGLDKIISGALDQAEGTADAGAPASAGKDTAGKPAAGDDGKAGKGAEGKQPTAAAASAGKEDGRDPATGRFTTKPAEAEASPARGTTDAAAKAGQAGGADPGQAAQAAQVQQAEPHARWTPERKAQFAALPPEGQKFALALQAESDAHATRLSQGFADLKRTAEPLLQAVEPFQQYLAQLAPVTGLTAPQMIAELMKTEHLLRTAPVPQKYAAFAEVARTYGIDIAALAQGRVALPDPAIANAQNETQALKQRLQEIEGLISRGQSEQVETAIADFANAKDAQGQPKYPHFDAFRAPMSKLMLDGKAATMEEAYNMATAPMRAAVDASLQAARSSDDQAREAAVRKAQVAAPVKTSGVAAGKTKGGLDTIIGGALDQAGIS
jgi:hypothetical protein